MNKELQQGTKKIIGMVQRGEKEISQKD